MTITLYTISWNGYWDKYHKSWTKYINRLDPQPDEIIIVSDKPIITNTLTCKNIVVVVESVQRGLDPRSHYRNIAVQKASSDWIMAADLDDKFYPWLISDIPSWADIHAISFAIHQKAIVYPNSDSLLNRFSLNPKPIYNLIPGTSPIKKCLFDKIKYENNCHEDEIFYAMAFKLNLKLSFDDKKQKHRFLYCGFHNNETKLQYEEATQIYKQILNNFNLKRYILNFDKQNNLPIKDSSLKHIETIDINCITFYTYEQNIIRINKNFKYLNKKDKSLYALAYMLYYNGGSFGIEDDFILEDYNSKLFTSRYDYFISKNFIDYPWIIFKPYTFTGFKWLENMNKKIDSYFQNKIAIENLTTSLLGIDMLPLNTGSKNDSWDYGLKK